MKIILAGNPNSGKTTLFNRLTGKNGRVGNWHGVTVGVREAAVKGTEHVVCDLPGVYSVKPYGEEEKVAAQALRGECDAIVNVIEARCLLRSLYLTRELVSLGKKIVIVITMERELERLGGRINPVNLTKTLGLPCMIADKNTGAEQIIKLLDSAPASPRVLPEPDRNAFIPPHPSGESAADKLLCDPVFAAPFFMLVMAAALYLTFGSYGLGTFLAEVFKTAVAKVAETAVSLIVRAGAGEFFTRLIREGIFGGVTAVIGFLPQLAILYLCLIIMEESGYLPRAAFAFDGSLSKVGLSGKTVFPLVAGFGCTATAILATRAAENARAQKNAILALHFISCSARMPAFLMITSAFFPGKEFIAVTLLYAFGITFGMFAAGLAAKFDKGGNEIFISEIPPLRIPRPITVLKQLKYYLKTFIIKIGTVLAAVSVVLWLMRSFSFRAEFLPAERISESILAKAGGALSFLFAPMGFRGWQIPVAAICGLVAKEGVVSALALAYPEGLGGFSPQSALALLVFVAYYTPCVMAISAAAGETNGRLSAFYGVFSFLAALLAGYITFFAAMAVTRFGAANTIFALCFVSAAAYFAGKIIKRIKNRGICDDKDRCGCAGQDCGFYNGCGRALSHREKTAPQKRRKTERQTHKYRFNMRKRGLD